MKFRPDPVISVKGNAYQRGHSYGLQASRMVRENVADYFRLWETTLGLARARVIKLAGDFAQPIGNYNARILEEMEGLAAGAELSLEEILAVNARYELMFAHAVPDHGAGPTPAAECTSLAACPPATTNGHTLIAQNWDNRRELKNRCILLEIQQSDRPNIVVHTEAGLIAHKGMNSAGIGICVNALLQQSDRFAAKVPFYV